MKSRILYKNNLKLVEVDNQKYILKKTNQNEHDIYNYLRSKDYNNFLPPVEKTSTYDLYQYINTELPTQDKAIELIYLMSMLHIKTTTFQEITLDKVKELYEETIQKITYLRDYYLDQQDYIETKIFMSPAEQLLMRNISKIYKALNYAEYKINSWYELKSKQKTERIVQLHNNLTTKNVLKSQNSYLINWENSKKGLVVYDFLNFYHNHYFEMEMTSLFREYQAKYKYTADETLLFQSLISLPPKLTFEKTNYINTLNARKVIDYVEITNVFLSEYYKEDKESNESKLTQQNNGI